MEIYSRNIDVKVELIESNLMKIIGVMKHKTEGAPKGESFKVELIVSMDNFEIIQVGNAEMDVLIPLCKEFIPQLQNIKGVSISAGYSKIIAEKIGGDNGCTHMVELLIEMGRSVYPAYHHGYITQQIGFDKALEEFKRRSKVKCMGLNRYGVDYKF